MMIIMMIATLGLLVLLIPVGGEKPSLGPVESNLTALPPAPIVVNDAGLDLALKAYTPFVLECWKLGCRPCKLMDPKVRQMAANFSGRIAFGSMCMDYNPITAARYDVSRAPTLLIFNNSSLVQSQVGNHPIEELERTILTALHMN